MDAIKAAAKSEYFLNVFAHQSVGHRLILIATSCLVFGWNLGATRLWDVDEAIFSETAVEMMDRGDWITPYYNGSLFSHKPPFMYWCQIAAFHGLGVTEFAARLFAAVFGVGTVLVTYEIGRILFNAQVGFWSGLILTGFINFAVICRAATPDSPLTFFCTLSLLILIYGAGSMRSSGSTGLDLPWHPSDPLAWKVYASSYAVMAIGSLVKGPVAIVLPMAVWGMFLLVVRDLAETGNRRHPAHPLAPLTHGVKYRLRCWLFEAMWFCNLFHPRQFLPTLWQMRPLTACMALLLIAGPWYVAVGWYTEGAFLREFFLVQNLERVTSAMEHHYGSILFYPATICIGTFPWCVLLAPAMLRMFNAIREHNPARLPYILLACWIGVWVGCFSIVATKLANYVVPAFPAIAICIGALVTDWLSQRQSAKYQQWLIRGWTTIGVVGFACLIAIPIATSTLFHGELTPALIGFVPIIGAAVGWHYICHKNTHRSLTTLAVTACSFAVGLLGFAVLPIDANKNTHLLAEVIPDDPESSVSVATYKYSPPSFLYYSRRFFDRLRSRDAVAQYFQKHSKNAFLITTEEQVPFLTGRLPRDFEVLRTERQFLKTTNIVVLGRSRVDSSPTPLITPHSSYLHSPTAN